MKRFIMKTILFFAVLIALDAACGVLFGRLVNTAKGGDTYLSNYICSKMKDECVIFGSSRGMHHYDPNIIGDSLGMSCWNCSLDGNGIILMYGRYKMMSERYAPKVLVYDVCTSFDLLDGDDNKHLLRLRYFYDRPGIDSIFWNVDKTERIKMLSNFYRYNSLWVQIVSDNIHPLQQNVKGYKPMDTSMTYEPKKKDTEKTEYRYDSLKLFYLEKLVVDCKKKGTRLVFAISPMYRMTDDSVYEPLKEICRKYKVLLINHYCDKRFVNTREYFSDSVHMNRTGATKYSKLLVEELKDIMKQK
jgi:hypothetical protein